MPRVKATELARRLALKRRGPALKKRATAVNFWVPRALRDRLVTAVWGAEAAARARAPNGIGELVARIVLQWVERRESEKRKTERREELNDEVPKV